MGSDDDLIKSLHPYFSDVFSDCFENGELRLERLFQVKEKWTIRELQSFLTDFLEPEIDAKFESWLVKNTRTLKEQNPFDQ